MSSQTSHKQGDCQMLCGGACLDEQSNSFDEGIEKSKALAFRVECSNEHTRTMMKYLHAKR